MYSAIVKRWLKRIQILPTLTYMKRAIWTKPIDFVNILRNITEIGQILYQPSPKIVIHHFIKKYLLRNWILEKMRECGRYVWHLLTWRNVHERDEKRESSAECGMFTFRLQTWLHICLALVKFLNVCVSRHNKMFFLLRRHFVFLIH